MAALETFTPTPQRIAETALNPRGFALWFDPLFDPMLQDRSVETLRFTRRPVGVITEANGEAKEMHPLEARLWESLLSTTLEKGYTPDRTRQRMIFDRLPWDTVLSEIEAEVGVSSKEGSRSLGKGKMLRGKVFELLVGADPAFGERSDLEKELLALAHAPEQFNLADRLGHYRNPDMAFLIMSDGDRLILEGVGETKLGLLNDRAFQQLSDGGFRKGVEALAGVINSLPDPLAYGLVEVAQAKQGQSPNEQLLTISPEFRQLLVVPANRKIEWVSTLLNNREFSRDEREAFRRLLSDPTRVVIAQSAFSTAEVGALAEELAGVLQEDAMIAPGEQELPQT